MPNIIQYQIELAIRIDPENSDHHIYNNNGTFWIHYTVYPTPNTAERVRKSLKTKDIKVARMRRNEIFATWPRAA